MRISVELVPRNETSLRKQLEQACGFEAVDTINVPDLMRFELRSWEACALACGRVGATIPHLRAADVDPDAPLPFLPVLRAHGMREVLVIGGDPPEGLPQPGGSRTLELIRRLKREAPDLTVWAAFDPYRQGFAEELAYADRKLAAGATGLFTQPFFDLRLLEVFAELLAGVEVFWGVTSVLTDRSRAYWTERNRAVFPAGFDATLEGNRRFARAALEAVGERGGHIYFMPIATGVRSYLDGVL